MLRKFTVVVGVTLSLLVVRDAYAVPIVPTDYDTWALTQGGSIAGPLPGIFVVADSPPPTMGEISNNVYFDGTLYTYTHTVTPDLNNNARFDTALPVAGFAGATGVAGWSFSQAGAAGGSGDDTDFLIEELGQLEWTSRFLEGGTRGWDMFEPITFFFVSSKPPGIGDYNLSAGEVGTAQSYTPIPEPGSIALLGSGLVGLYTAMRRRRSLRA